MIENEGGSESLPQTQVMNRRPYLVTTIYKGFLQIFPIFIGANIFLQDWSSVFTDEL